MISSMCGCKGDISIDFLHTPMIFVAKQGDANFFDLQLLTNMVFKLDGVHFSNSIPFTHIVVKC